VLELRLAPFHVDAELAPTLPGLREGLHARLTVTDSGTGMDASILEHIFEPFFSTKGQGQGTGLGLSVVHGIVRGHHGAIAVQSERGEGTRFDLYFPAAEAASHEIASSPAASPRGNGERVLYLDDEERLVFLAGRGLERLGYAFTGFSNPVQALAAFHAQPTAFDIVVTDLTMPLMTGFDLATELVRLRPDLPIILTSGYLRPQDVETARRIGFRKFIPKPVSLDELACAIHEVLNRGGTAGQP
jgi:CheY-like chemotaxis protein